MRYLVLPILLLLSLLVTVLGAPYFLLLKLLHKLGWVDLSTPDVWVSGSWLLADEIQVLRFEVHCAPERRPTAYLLFVEWLQLLEPATTSEVAQLWQWQREEQEFHSRSLPAREALGRLTSELTEPDEWFPEPSRWLLCDPEAHRDEGLEDPLRQSLQFFPDDQGLSTADLHQASGSRATLAVTTSWDQGQVHLHAELATHPALIPNAKAAIEEWQLGPAGKDWKIESV